MVIDLKGIKIWVKVVKWVDVFVGFLFDVVIVVVSVWQFVEVIKSKDEMVIFLSVFGFVLGLVGIIGFVVVVFVIVGLMIVVVVGFIGVVVGVVLGIVLIIVEIIVFINFYNEINQYIEMIKILIENFKKLLDVDKENFNNFVFSWIDFIFFWVFEVNQGFLLEYV